MKPSGPKIMEVALAHYKACEDEEAQLDAPRNGAFVGGQARLL
jgi:hypothetical protein